MANIIRCKLPDGVHRFKPFSVADYRDFLMVQNDLLTKETPEQEEIVEELMEEYFPQYPQSWRHYIFLKVFTGSVGKTKIPITYTCPVCGKKTPRLFNLSQEPLENPTIEVNERLSLTFKFPDEIIEDAEKIILDNISKVTLDGNTYDWEQLDEETQSNVIGMLELDKYEEMVKKLKPIHFEIVLRCCRKDTITYDDIHSVFKLLINPDEVFPFYQINHVLSNAGYGMDAILKMYPSERSFYLSLVEKDKKK